MFELTHNQGPNESSILFLVSQPRDAVLPRRTQLLDGFAAYQGCCTRSLPFVRVRQSANHVSSLRRLDHRANARRR